MKRLTTRHQREDRVLDVFGATVCIGVLVACGWSVAQDGWLAMALWLGSFAVVLLIAFGVVALRRWIDTGRWFR